MYNSKDGRWIRVKAPPIRWGQRAAYLLGCFDITEYTTATPPREARQIGR